MAKKTTLSYSGNEVTLADENGNTAIYILGSAGYATECTYKLSDQVINKLQNNEYEIDELQKCTTRSLELLKFCKSKLFETDEALQKILAELND